MYKFTNYYLENHYQDKGLTLEEAIELDQKYIKICSIIDTVNVPKRLILIELISEM